MTIARCCEVRNICRTKRCSSLALRDKPSCWTDGPGSARQAHLIEPDDKWMPQPLVVDDLPLYVVCDLDPALEVISYTLIQTSGPHSSALQPRTCLTGRQGCSTLSPRSMSLTATSQSFTVSWARVTTPNEPCARVRTYRRHRALSRRAIWQSGLDDQGQRPYQLISRIAGRSDLQRS